MTILCLISCKTTPVVINNDYPTPPAYPTDLKITHTGDNFIFDKPSFKKLFDWKTDVETYFNMYILE